MVAWIKVETASQDAVDGSLRLVIIIAASVVVLRF